MTFKNIGELQTYIRLSGKAPTMVTIEQVLFTLDFYSENGKQSVTYGNKRTGKGIRVETHNKNYSTHDAVVSESVFVQQHDVYYWD